MDFSMISSDEKQTILIVHNYYKIPGGEDSVVRNEKKLLEENGHKVVLYERYNSEMEQMNFLGKLLMPFSSLFNIKSYREIRNIIAEQKIDVVHVHNTLFRVSPAVYYAAVSLGVPVVQTLHNFRLNCPNATFFRDGKVCEECVEHGLSRAVKYGCYRDSRLQTFVCVVNMKIHRLLGIYKKINYICLTDFNKNKLMHLKGINEQNVFIKPNFVAEQCAEIKKADERKQQFVYVGRTEKLKGIDSLLKAWKEMGQDAPQLIICGTGDLEEWCREYIEQNRLNVKMLGRISNADVKALVGESIALIQSTCCYEGMPMNIVEAYSVGTAVIGRRIGNVETMVAENVTGFLFDSEEELCRIVREKTIGDEMYQAAKQIYLDKYTDRANYAELKYIYDTVTR